MRLSGLIAIIVVAVVLAAAGGAVRWRSVKPVQPAPTDVAATIRAWGLVGKWSQECSLRPGEENGLYEFAAGSSGVAIFRRDYGRVKDANRIVQARRLADDRLEIVVDYQSFSPAFVSRQVYAKTSNGNIRTTENEKNIKTHEFTVKDGFNLRTGRPTSELGKCSG